MTLINAHLTDAYHAFLSSIAAAKSQNIAVTVLEEQCQEKIDQLNVRMERLTEFALEGMEEDLSRLLSIQLIEWAKKEALEMLLMYGQVDPDDLGLQQSFWEKLNSQQQDLSAELLLHLQRGKKQRAQAAVEHAQSWQSVVSRAIENQQQQQQHWQNAAFQWVQGQQQLNQQWFQHEEQMFHQHQQANREWANVAMVGVQQAQVGMKQWYDFAASTQQNVANMLAGAEQRQGQLVQEAVHKANTKKWVARLTIIGLVMGGMVALFGCAFFAMMHLY